MRNEPSRIEKKALCSRISSITNAKKIPFHEANLCDIGEIEKEMWGVLQSARHVKTRRHYVRAQSSTGQIARDAHLEEIEGCVHAVLVDAQLRRDLTEEIRLQGTQQAVCHYPQKMRVDKDDLQLRT